MIVTIYLLIIHELNEHCIEMFCISSGRHDGGLASQSPAVPAEAVTTHNIKLL